MVDASSQPCAASPGCLIATDKLHDSFDGHCRDTIAEIGAVFANGERGLVRAAV
jgi:hypothetical protein